MQDHLIKIDDDENDINIDIDDGSHSDTVCPSVKKNDVD